SVRGWDALRSHRSPYLPTVPESKSRMQVASGLRASVPSVGIQRFSPCLASRSTLSCEALARLNLFAKPIRRHELDQNAFAFTEAVLESDMSNAGFGDVHVSLLAADQPGSQFSQVRLVADKGDLVLSQPFEIAAEAAAFAVGSKLFADLDFGPRQT